MKPIAKLEDWIEDNRERLSKMPLRLRPRILNKPISMRRPSQKKRNLQEVPMTNIFGFLIIPDISVRVNKI
jgi:hypothetical protein